MTWRAFLGASE